MSDNKVVTPIDLFLAKTVLFFVPRSVLPNHFTVLRLISIPLVGFLLWNRYYEIGLIFFSLSAITDALDGALARTRNQISEWGKKYDPVADKLLMATTATILISQYFPIWVPAVIIFMELVLICGFISRSSRQNLKITPNIFGKLKMIFQVLGIFFLLLHILDWGLVLWGLAVFCIYLSIGLQLVALFFYWRTLRVIH